ARSARTKPASCTLPPTTRASSTASSPSHDERSLRYQATTPASATLPAPAVPSSLTPSLRRRGLPASQPAEHPAPARWYRSPRPRPEAPPQEAPARHREQRHSEYQHHQHQHEKHVAPPKKPFAVRSRRCWSKSQPPPGTPLSASRFIAL